MMQKNILSPVVRSGLADVTGSATGEEIGREVRGAVDTSLDNRNSARTYEFLVSMPSSDRKCAVLVLVLVLCEFRTRTLLYGQ